jgi:hypothetical protein
MIVMPAMPLPQEKVWLSLFRIAEALPDGWTLIGGQMVHLFCAERGATPHRTTTDGDTVVDIRADRQMLERFTQELRRLGFTSVGVSAEGHEHRWRNGDAIIDVLIAHSLGDRSQTVTGATGSTTVSASGAQQALNRSELVEVLVGDSSGKVRRPSLVGALIIKAAAMSAPSGDRERHKADFALLSTMIRPSDNLTELTARDRRHLTRGITATRLSPVAHEVPGWQVGIDRLELAMRPL